MGLKAAIRAPLRGIGFDVHRYPPLARPPWLDDFTAEEVELHRLVQPYTMTSPEAVAVLASTVRYLVNAMIPGAIAECGVWKGGA
jgi:O-methyltransferase